MLVQEIQEQGYDTRQFVVRAHASKGLTEQAFNVDSFTMDELLRLVQDFKLAGAKLPDGDTISFVFPKALKG